MSECDDHQAQRRLLDEALSQGTARAELADGDRLDWSRGTTPREAALRRVLVAVRVPLGALAALGPLLPGGNRRRIWFEFLLRLAFWRGVRRTVTRSRWSQLTRGVPVLMYHAFGAAGSASRYVVPAARFAWQMRVLAALRYRVLTLADLAVALGKHQLPPGRVAVLTIDDGYRDNLELASPVLRRRRFPATLFLVSERLGGRNDWDADGELAGRALLTRADLGELAAAGVVFGAHTRTHPALADAPAERVTAEVAGSRADLEGIIGAPVVAFSYPHGRYDDHAVAAVRGADFTCACTTDPRRARLGEDPLLVPRIEIRGTDSRLTFLRTFCCFRGSFG